MNIPGTHQEDEEFEGDDDKSSAKIYVEQDWKQLSFTNSCWEIQRFDSFFGGKMNWEEKVWFRHIGSGKYLSAKNLLSLYQAGTEDECSFTIKSDGLEEDS